MNIKSIELIIQENRVSDYARVVNFIEINNAHSLAVKDDFLKFLMAAYQRYSDNSILNLLLKAKVDFSKYMSERTVIVLSPNPYSRYTLSVVEKLIVMGFSVEAIICVKFGIKRVIGEFRKSAPGLVKKVLNKIVLREKYYGKTSSPRFSDLRSLSKELHIPLLWVESLNSADFVRICESLRSGLLVFTGGGIIGAQTFDALPEKKFINCHSGILPKYRGMDCNYWAIMNGDFDNVGVSCHFMTPFIDRGDIISTRKVDISADISSVRELDLVVEREMAISICEAVDFYLNGKSSVTPQAFEDGKKFFKMHERYFNIVELILSDEN